ncbi:MAG: hypothetical protein WCR54_04000 [Clostridia bacterium]
MLVPINNDVLDIAWSIKQVDDSYYIMYDTNKHKFLLYSSKGYQLTFPFSQLDMRAIRYAKHTRIENLDTLIDEMDKFNKEKEKEDIKNIHNEFEEKCDLALRQI